MSTPYDEQHLDPVPAEDASPQKPTKQFLTMVRIANFKRIEHAELELGPVTYIVGGNNSGKSSVLQAIHTATTIAQLSQNRNKYVLPTSVLRYTLATSFETIGHRQILGNRNEGFHAEVTFFNSEDEMNEDHIHTMKFYRGSNYNSIRINTLPNSSGALTQQISNSERLFSIYTPGLSGIPLYEEYMSYASVFQRAAGGEANYVFRNILRLIDEEGKLDDLENAVSKLVGDDIQFEVEANETHDFHITVKAYIGSEDYYPIPVELWGTGLLQITQLYSYVILFQPSVFLADEPDAHLHPSRQRLLASAFDDIAENYGCQVIAATHSVHLINARPSNAKLIWMRNGNSQSYENPNLIPLLMHLDGLEDINPQEKQIILLTEDEDHQLLARAVNELKNDGYEVVIKPVNGVGNLRVAGIFEALKNLMPNGTRILIHRDRDFLIDDEIEGWLNQTFSTSAARPDVFVTRYCDMEAYYCSKDYILRLYQDEPNIADYYDRALRKFENHARTEFAHKRKANNKANFLPEGGSPTNQSLWPDSEPVSVKTVVGKLFLKRLIGELRQYRIDVSRIGSVAPNELLEDLRNCFDAPSAIDSSGNTQDFN
ncbi:MAG: AAA family ATPase [Actinomyces sp.]|jgi:hypothetical protein|nr:AAA family ATPase [Actinomyces sp.]